MNNDLVFRDDVLKCAEMLRVPMEHESYNDCRAVSVNDILAVPAVDAVEVVRCKDCVYWKPRHIKLNDGSERAYFPGESYVGITVGINVGSQCMVDEYSGYGCDKSVFRRENDFCSRGKRKMDSGVQDD